MACFQAFGPLGTGPISRLGSLSRESQHARERLSLADFVSLQQRSARRGFSSQSCVDCVPTFSCRGGRMAERKRTALMVSRVRRCASQAPTPVVLLGYLALSMLLRLPFSFVSVIDWDESTFIIMGQEILDGHLPYTRLWDFKLPRRRPREYWPQHDRQSVTGPGQGETLSPLCSQSPLPRRDVIVRRRPACPSRLLLPCRSRF